jgi:hypothetical protein
MALYRRDWARLPCSETVITLRAFNVEAIIGIDEVLPVAVARVVVAERSAELNPTSEKLGIGPIELLLEVLLVAATPPSPVNVVTEHENQ